MKHETRKKQVRPTPRVAGLLHRLGEIFSDRIGRRTSMSALSLKMSASRGFLQKVKVHRWGGRVGEILGTLELAGDEMPLDAFHEAFEDGPCDAKAVLASSRERQTRLPPKPFLLAMAKRLGALGKSASVSDERTWRCQLEAIRRFEELRFTNRRLSEEKLEWLVGVMVAMLERMAVKPAKAMANLACALCGLAAAYRIGGRRDDALDLLLFAHPLAMIADDPLAEGVWYQKAAYLLMDLDRCDRAYEFVLEAAMLFLTACAEEQQLQTLVDRALVLGRAGRSEEALKVLRRALRLIPKTDIIYRLAAHHNCFIELRKLGKYQEALVEFELVLGLTEKFPLIRAGLLWSRARLAVQLSDTTGAKAYFREALHLHRRNGCVAEAAELTFEFADLLQRENCRPELKELAADASEWSSAIKGHRRVREAVENLAALTELRELDLAAIAELRRSLPAKAKGAPSYRRSSRAQPPGGVYSPNWSRTPKSELPGLPVEGAAPSSTAPGPEPASGSSNPASVDPETNATN